MTDWVSELCTHLGVHAAYRGYEGQTVEVSRGTRLAVLRAMGLDVSSDEDAKACLDDMLSSEACRPLSPEVIVQADQPGVVAVAFPVEWVLEAEGSGKILAQGHATHSLSLPALPLGIHRLRLRGNLREMTTWVLARPARALCLSDQMAEPRIWGVLAALYGLTDGNAAQIGSFDALGQYAAAMAGHGADFVGINPVHAMGKLRPDNVISPYSPSHRAFLNTWYCQTADVPKAAHSDLVDYPAALHANEVDLSAQFAAFRARPDDAPDKQAFAAYCARSGADLESYAVFEALSARFGPDWRCWPAAYRDSRADALGSFSAAQKDAIQRTKWAQWQAEQQLAEAQAQARNAGMRVGLYLDLAVGPRLGGAETWGEDTSLVTGATLGAPPDPLGPTGQSWGLAPQCPLKCRAEGFAGFARLLRSNMQHAGMIRIDHVLGLMRSFWIPEGAAEGTYVSYPFDALLAVVAIESQRCGTIVVGEDLGLVPKGLRAKLAASGIYGLDVLQYMRTPEGGFADTSQTRALAICGFATHDTPTVAGFFKAEDARVRYQSGSIGVDTLNETRADRARALQTLAGSDPVAEIHRQLARASSSMVAIQLDDIAGRVSQQNLPGTIDSYPNWRLKAPFTVSQIETSSAFVQLASDMRAQKRSNPKAMEPAHGLQNC